MKTAEKRINKEKHYEMLENTVRQEAKETFYRPPYIRNKLTDIGALKIIERNIEFLAPEESKAIHEMAFRVQEGRRKRCTTKGT